MRSEKKIITVDGENAGRIRHNPLAPNISMSAKSRQKTQKTAPGEAKSPFTDHNVSPAKVSKTRSKYANVPSKISSGVVNAKPPIPNFVANKAKREAEQVKVDRMAPSKYL